LIARLSGAKAWLHVQDFELEAATKLGLLASGHRLVRWAVRFESRVLRAFDRVSTISASMLARLVQKGVRPEWAYLFPNWVDIKTIYPLPDEGLSAREEFGLPSNKVIVLYAGNMGVKQGLEIMLEAARELRKNSAFHFILCGEGSARAQLERTAGELRNVQFLPLQSPEKLNSLLNIADMHVLPQRQDAADLVMPSKLLGMLASGKPVIAMANPDTEIGKVVGQVGVLIPPADLSALCEALLKLGISPDLRASLGRKGRAFVCKYWSSGHILRDFELQLPGLRMKKGKHTGKSLFLRKRNSS
jgi:colanic acid biosynthesis glycosyl transferase WcaI